MNQITFFTVLSIFLCFCVTDSVNLARRQILLGGGKIDTISRDKNYTLPVSMSVTNVNFNSWKPSESIRIFLLNLICP